MKHFLLFCGFFIAFLFQANCAFSQAAPNFDWAKRAGSTGADAGYAIAVDASGNTYAAGSFDGTVTFGNITLNGNDTDIYLVKYDPSGNVLWARKAGGTQFDYARAVEIDAAGNCFLIGDFTGTAVFGNTTLLANGTGSGTDAFVAKFEPTGNMPWVVRIGGAASESAWDIELDAAGNIYLSGHFAFGLAVIGSNAFNAVGYGDSFIAKMNSTGTILWAKRVGGPQSHDVTLYEIALDATGNILATGYFQNVANIGSFNLQSSAFGDRDLFIAKYDPVGNVLWAKKAGGAAGMDTGSSIEVDGSGSSYISGVFYGQAFFDNLSVTSSGAGDVFLAKYDAAGNALWIKQAGGAGSDGSNEVVLDGSGNLYLAGGFTDTAAFGTTNLISSGNSDVFVAKYDAAGNALWAKRAGGEFRDVCYAMAVDNGGNTYLTGVFSTGNPGNRSYGAYFDNIYLSGVPDLYISPDMFVAKLGNAPVACVTPTATISKACSGNSQNITFNLTGQAPWRIFYNRNSTAEVIHTSNSTYTVTVPNSTFTETFTLTAVSSGNCHAPVTGSVVLTPLPRPQFTSSTGCVGPRTLTVTGAAAGATYNWYTSATATTPIASANNGTYTTPHLYNNTNYYVSIVDASGCEGPRTTVTATVSPVPTGSVAPGRTVCASAAPFIIAVNSPAGGTWSGPGVTPSGLFTPSHSMSGPQVLTYSFNPFGCPGSASTTINVLPGPATPSITFIAPDTLMASGSTGIYEWKYNGATLPNNTQKLKVTASGIYAVKAIGNGSCASAFSPDYNYTVSGLKEDKESFFSIYPNPTTGIVNLVLNKQDEVQVTVFNALGQVVLNKTLGKTDQKVATPLDLSGVAKGIYLVQVKAEKQVFVKKLILE